VWPAAVYTFLEFIDRDQRRKDAPLEKKVLDCGAGGAKPPLGLFYNHGYEVHGIDISDDQIIKAKEFGAKHRMELHICKGDMRNIPFEDEFFSFVFEYYSICHLTKEDIQTAIKEMTRVLKKDGLLFLGFMSDESWPIFGEEKKSGEFWLSERDDDIVVHSVFTDDETDEYLAGFNIVWKEKRISWIGESYRDVSKDEWMEWYDKQPAMTRYSREDWSQMYEYRENKAMYTHIYYIARRPLDNQ